MKHDLSAKLAGHPFVQGLSEDHIKFLTGCIANVKFMPGEYVFREGEPADLLFLLRSGQVAVQVYGPGRGVTTLSTMGAGEIVGWSWAVPPYISHFDVVAQQMTLALSVDAKCLRAKCETDPEFGYQMLARMVKVIERRLTATRIQLLDMYGSHR
ncbi:MAG: cyclic nucleotide-binding domain-containing protein [Fimbriimonas sp.]|nr:cyclic nucleotide-binding domain-containing protein [Fimbriimonas sp.]